MQADHSGPMLRKHYWEVVDRETAERYWAIRLKIYSSNQDRWTLAAVGNPSFRSRIMTSAWNPSNVCAELRRTPEETKAHLAELQRAGRFASWRAFGVE
jgi:hypothetical protein